MQYGPGRYANNTDELITSCILGYYVKYDRLKLLIDTTFSGSNATEVDIYIDIKDILFKVDRYLNDTCLPIKNPLVITSGIINMIAHYRNFFHTRYRCTTRFFIIDSIGELLSCQYCSEYKVPQLSDRMISLYTKNLEILPMITKYIHDVQFIAACTNIVTKALSIHHIETKKNPSIIISKDEYNIQASADSDFYVLIPKKNKTGDVSILSTSASASATYIYLITRGQHDLTKYITPNLIPMLMGMTRVPTRSLQTIMNIPSALKKLSSDIHGTIAISYYPSDIPSFLRYILKNSKYDKQQSRIHYRYQACDATGTLYAGYKMHPEYLTYNGIINLYDPNSIKVINNEYFKDCPLDLNVL